MAATETYFLNHYTSVKFTVNHILLNPVSYMILGELSSKLTVNLEQRQHDSEPRHENQTTKEQLREK